MRTFKNFPEDTVCPICGTNDNKECVLIPITGTHNGNICEAKVVHVECVNVKHMVFSEYAKVIYIPCKEES